MLRRFIAPVVLLLAVAFAAACGGGGGGGGGADQNPAPPAYRLSGLAVGFYVDGQDPNVDPRIGDAQLRERLAIVARYTERIRTFGSADGLENACALAREKSLVCAAGAWIGRDSAANERQLANLIAIGRSGNAALLVVGSEVLLRGDASEEALLAYISRVKASVSGVQVTYGDTYAVLLAHPRVMAAVDVILANHYPYWEGVSVDDAVAAIHAQHRQLVAAGGGKPVLVGETGWPSGGNTIGSAVPSEANAAKFFINFVSWARATGTGYYYFSALDEAWKAKYEGPQGARWGVWTSAGAMKPGMQQVFDGATVADNWSTQRIPGGPGTASIEFTAVPPYGSNADLAGRVLHVDPLAHKVAVYIQVAGSWWTKPTAAAPLTSIAASGAWTTDITTGGNDAQATRIAAFLVRNGYNPPVLLGSATLPAALGQNAVARIEVARSP